MEQVILVDKDDNAIGTMEKLIRDEKSIYGRLEAIGAKMEAGLTKLFREAGIAATVARQGSAFCAYFMDHLPLDWHDIAQHHDMNLDLRYRKALIEKGIYQFPLPTKQGSISAAHTEADIEQTLEVSAEAIRSLHR